MAQADLAVWIFGRLPVFGRTTDFGEPISTSSAVLRCLRAEAGNTLLGEGARHHDKRFRYFIRMFENR